ncbi:MAG: capsular biosynthesis protein [Gammaproteobacteria bacterium]|nr:capsular biosynthesis protein [Gammaproteobacteria bacterium]
MLLSGTNFAVSLLLIRYSTDRDYGMYVLLQSAVLLLTSAQNAWLTGPLATLTAKLLPDVRAQTITSVRSIQLRALLRGALPVFLVPAVGYATGYFSGLLALVVAIGIVACWGALRREYLRSTLFMYAQPQALLKADAAYAIVLIAVVAAGLIGGKYVVVVAACGVAVAALIGDVVARRSIAASPGWLAGEGAPIWPQLRNLGNWALLGSTIYWFLGQSYSYMLATRLDLKAVADVNAMRALMNPAILLTIGIVSMLMPTAARWYAQIGLQRLVRRLLLVLLLVGAAESAYFIAVWLGRDWLVHNIFHKTIEDRDRLLILWGGVAIMALLRDIMQCALTAMGQFRSLAWQVGLSATVAVLLMWFGMRWWGPAAVLIGQIVGEVVNFIGIILLLRQSMRRADST